MITASVPLPSIAAPAPVRTAVRSRILVASLLITLLIAVGVAAGVGTQRMFRAAPLASVDAATGQQVVGYQWSSWPLDFTVRYADGSRTTHLWW